MSTKESQETNEADFNASKLRVEREVQGSIMGMLGNAELDVLMHSLESEISALKSTTKIKVDRLAMVKWEAHRRWTQS